MQFSQRKIKHWLKFSENLKNLLIRGGNKSLNIEKICQKIGKFCLSVQGIKTYTLGKHFRKSERFAYTLNRNVCKSWKKKPETLVRITLELLFRLKQNHSIMMKSILRARGTDAAVAERKGQKSVKFAVGLKVCTKFKYRFQFY